MGPNTKAIHLTESRKFVTKLILNTICVNVSISLGISLDTDKLRANV